MRKREPNITSVKRHRPREEIHDAVIRYLALTAIIALFFLDVKHLADFKYYPETYAVLGVFILFGKKDLLSILKFIKKL